MVLHLPELRGSERLSWEPFYSTHSILQPIVGCGVHVCGLTEIEQAPSPINRERNEVHVSLIIYYFSPGPHDCILALLKWKINQIKCLNMRPIIRGLFDNL